MKIKVSSALFVFSIFLLFSIFGGIIGKLSGAGASIRPHCEVAVGYAMTGKLPVFCDKSRSDPSAVERLSKFLSRDGEEKLDSSGLIFGELESTEQADQWIILPLSGLWLQGVMGSIWRIFGISWDVASVGLGAIFYGISGLFSVLTFRRFLPWLWAVLLSAAILSSPVVLESLPHFRDFGKLPFFIFSAWLSLQFSIGSEKLGWKTIVLSFAGGIFLGFGLGIRSDVLAAVVAVIVCLLVSSNQQTALLKSAGQKLALIIIFVLGVSVPTIAKSSLIPQRGDDGSFFHLVLLGQSNQMTNLLGVRNGDIRLPVKYHDINSSALASDYASRKLEESPVFMGAGYGKATKGAFFEHLWNTPFDQLVRGSGVMVSGLQGVPVRYYRGWWNNHSKSKFLAQYINKDRKGWPRWCRNVTGAFESVFATFGALICVLVLCLTWNHNRRIGAWLFVMLFLWLGAGVLQFDGRHLFHIEFIRLGLIGVGGYNVVVLFKSGGGRALYKLFKINKLQWRWAPGLFTCVFLIGVGSYVWQKKSMSKIVVEVEDATRTPVPYDVSEKSQSGFVYYDFPNAEALSKQGVSFYIRLELDGVKAPGKIWMLYKRNYLYLGDVSYPVAFTPNGSVDVIYLPVFSGVFDSGFKYVDSAWPRDNVTEFEGLLLSTTVERAVKKIEVVKRDSLSSPPYVLILDKVRGKYDLTSQRVGVFGDDGNSIFNNYYYPSWFSAEKSL